MAAARAPVQQQSTPAAVPKSTQPSVNHAAQPTPQSLTGPPALRLSQSSAPSAGLPTEVARAVSASNSGSPLPAPTQTTLQNSLQVDLSPVRVHSDRMAASAAASVQARAFTYGHHIYLGAGQHSSDTSLMAHEAAHVVQQQNGAAVQTWSASGAGNGDAFEAEARAVAPAVERGQPASIEGRTGGQQIQRDALPQQVSAPAAQAEEGGLIGRVRGAIAGMVRSIPGYMLISFIIGRDVVANTPVERNATNLVGAVLGLIPGGNAMFENLQRSGALQRAFDWLNSEFVRLNFTGDYISGLFRRFVSTLGIFDIIPSRLLSRITETFGEPLRRLRDFAASAAMKVLEFIFEGVMGAGGAQILALLKRARSVFDMIVRDPLGFVNNLIRAVVGGFNQFKNNVVAHLQAGLIGWLTGALGGAGITLPPRFDLRGILSLVLQILGLTYQQIRPRLVRVLGESKMRLLEGAFEFLRILVTQGLAAAWQKIIEFAGNLTDMVLGGIRDFVVQTVVQQAIVRLIALFNPLGAIIQAIMGIYTTIQWFIQRIQQIMALVNSVLDSLANIASGNLTAAMNYVEQTMARALPVIISFLAGFVGLNRIADNVRDIIRRIQGVIGNAIDRVINFVVERVRAFAGPGGDQDPNARLESATQEGTAALNRYAGRRVGALVLRPLLAVIRLRYRLTSLDVVQDGDRWAVEAVINPKRRQRTDAQAEGMAGTNAAPVAEIRGPIIVLRVVVGSQTFNIEHSLQRHHYLRLQTGGVEEENSIMYASLPIETARQDLIELGRQIQTKLTRDTRGAVEGRYSVGERTYRVNRPNHAFVTQGGSVWGGVSTQEWLATRSVRQIQVGAAPSNVALNYQNIRRMLSRAAVQRLRAAGRLPENYMQRVPFVATMVDQFRALSPASINRIVQVSNQQQIVDAVVYLVETDR
jgi:hypothetical protein